MGRIGRVILFHEGEDELLVMGRSSGQSHVEVVDFGLGIIPIIEEVLELVEEGFDLSP